MRFILNLLNSFWPFFVSIALGIMEALDADPSAFRVLIFATVMFCLWSLLGVFGLWITMGTGDIEKVLKDMTPMSIKLIAFRNWLGAYLAILFIYFGHLPIAIFTLIVFILYWATFMYIGDLLKLLKDKSVDDRLKQTKENQR